jgi:DNA replication protein DnaC
MLIQPTIEKLHAMKLFAMADAFTAQLHQPDLARLSFEERFGLLVDHQMTAIDNRRLTTRLKTAHLRLSAAIEDLNFRTDRNLDRATILSLAQNHWVRNHLNILITGPTGVGKSYLACALAQKACRDGFATLYQRVPRLLQDLAVARHDGRYHKIMATLTKCEVLVLDDFLITTFDTADQRELLEIVEDRYDRKATIVTSQLPIRAWHDAMQDKTLADAILDRLVHNAYKLELEGGTMRRRKTPLDPKTEPVSQ